MTLNRKYLLFLVLINCVLSSEILQTKFQRQMFRLKYLNNKILDLKNCNLTRDEIEVLGIFLLDSRDEVVELNLSGNDLSNRDTLLLILTLEFTGLSELIISNTKIQSEHVKLLTSKLSQTQIRLIDLSKNLIKKHEMIEFIKTLRYTKVRELILDDNQITDEVSKIIADEVPQTKLRKINLNNNLISNLGAELLVRNLLENDVEFSLDGNRLGDEGAALMINQLKLKNKLKFSLRRNNVTFRGSFDIAKGLTSSKLTHLDLAGNNLGDSGTAIISSAFKHSQLKSIDLSDNSINVDGGRMLKDQLISSSNISFVELNSDVFFSVDIHTISSFCNCLNIQKLTLKVTGIFGESDSTEFISRLKYTKVSDLTLDISQNYKRSYNMFIPTLIANLKGLTALKIVDSNCNDGMILSLAKVVAKSNLKHFSLKLKCFLEFDNFNFVKNSKLTDLEMNIAYFNDIDRLMEAVADSKITKLILGNVFIPYRSFSSVAKSLKRSSLTVFHLSHCFFSNIPVSKIAEILPFTKIRELHLHSDGITDKGIEVLAKFLPQSQINVLNLDENLISNDGIMFIAAILCNTNITELHLNRKYNLGIDDKVVLERIDFCLEQNRMKLKNKVEKVQFGNQINKIYLSNNPMLLDGEVMLSFVDVLGKLNITEIDLFHSNSSKNERNDHLDRNLQKLLRGNKKILSFKMNQQVPLLDYYLERNNILFSRAKSFVDKFDNNSVEVEVNESELDAYKLFEATVDLWGDRRNVGDLKDKILKRINFVKPKTNYSSCTSVNLPFVFLNFAFVMILINERFVLI